MERLLKTYACNKASDATHLSLIGGKFNIPNVDLFFRTYAKSYQTLGAHLVERVSYPSKWYVDLDHLPPDYVDHTLKDLLVDHREDCIVCVPSERDAVHIIFHNVVVDSPDEAVQKTARLFSDFDRSVYRSGLRMIGSKKKANVAREYYPYFYIREGRLTHPPTARTITYEDLVLASIHTQLPKIRVPSRTSICGTTAATTTTLFDFGFIHPNYKHVGVSQIKPIKSGFKVLVKSRYCMNIDREHTSNHVFFVVRNNAPMEVHAECFNDCACRGYKSKPYRIPVVLYYNIKNNLIQ
jgi:hypothetical protein